MANHQSPAVSPRVQTGQPATWSNSIHVSNANRSSVNLMVSPIVISRHYQGSLPVCHMQQISGSVESVNCSLPDTPSVTSPIPLHSSHQLTAIICLTVTATPPWLNPFQLKCPSPVTHPDQ